MQMTQGSTPSACIAKTIPLQVSDFTVDGVFSQRTWYQQCVIELEGLKALR